MPSVEHELVVAMMSGSLGLDELSINDQRALMELSAEMFPLEADVVVSEIDADGVPADWVSVGESLYLPARLGCRPGLILRVRGQLPNQAQ